MSQEARRYEGTEVKDSASAHFGDVINHVHKEEKKVNLYRILVNSLHFPGLDARIRNVATALPETSKWLPSHPAFLEWLDPEQMVDHHGFIWLKGKPGSGKSTIMKQAVTWAKDAPSGERITLTYFYNARSPELLDKSALGMYRSILWHLLEVLPEIRGMFEETFRSKVNIQTGEVEQWSETEIQNCLIDIIKRGPPQSYMLFIDALDEGEEDDIREMVTFFEAVSEHAIAARCPLRICFSSRHYPNISIEKSVSLILENQVEHARDLELYIRKQLRGQGMPGFEGLRQQVQARSGGIFLWVVLVVPMLNKSYDGEKSMKVMLKRLVEIPVQLRQIFSQIFISVSQDPDEFEVFKSILQWVLYAYEAMSPIELYYTVVQRSMSQTEEKQEEGYSVDEITAMRYLRHCSRGLVEETRSPEYPSNLGVTTVQFIHQTVRDYLDWDNLSRDEELHAILPSVSLQAFQPEQCHATLAQRCLHQLLETLDVEPTGRLSLPEHPLNRYGARCWGQHFRIGPKPYSEILINQAVKFLSGDVRNKTLWDRCITDFDFFSGGELAPLIRAALLGSTEVVSHMLATGIDVNSRHRSGWTALDIAALYGYDDIVQLLIDARADVHARDEFGGTALWLAVFGDHPRVVKILANAFVSHGLNQEDHAEALSLAKKYDYVEILQILEDLTPLLPSRLMRKRKRSQEDLGAMPIDS